MNEQANTIWSLPTAVPEAGGPGRGADDIAVWRDLAARVAALARAKGWTKAEVSRRSGVPDGTLNQWFSGLYKGRIDTTNGKILAWLYQVEEMDALAAGIPTSPGHIEMRISGEVAQTLLFAQQIPEMVVVTLGAGMGKTFACRQYCATRPHAFLVTMSPKTASVHGMLGEIAEKLGVSQQNPARLHRAIGDRLQRNGRKTLLVIDEAQNLFDAAVDQLRSLLDINECGIALVGTDEIYNRFFRQEKQGPSYAQIKRRIGKRLRRLQPYPEDITALIDAWGVTDEGARRLLTGIGNKPGALGQIDKTMKLAGFTASGLGETIGEKHIRAAWKNRDVEG